MSDGAMNQTVSRRPLSSEVRVWT